MVWVIFKKTNPDYIYIFDYISLLINLKYLIKTIVQFVMLHLSVESAYRSGPYLLSRIPIFHTVFAVGGAKN